MLLDSSEPVEEVYCRSLEGSNKFRGVTALSLDIEGREIAARNIDLPPPDTVYCQVAVANVVSEVSKLACTIALERVINEFLCQPGSLIDCSPIGHP